MFCTHWPQSQGIAGRSEEVSLSGMRFLTNENLSEGQYIKIVGTLPRATLHSKTDLSLSGFVYRN